MLSAGSKVGIVCCSNGMPTEAVDQMKKLEGYLSGLGLIPVFGEYIYRQDGVFSGTPR